MSSEPARIALIGLGAIGRTLAARLTQQGEDFALAALLRRPAPGAALAHITPFLSLEALIAWRPRLVVECAGHEAVREIVPPILSRGIPVVIASVGALADGGILAQVRNCARAGGVKAGIVSGAVGGLDALAAARYAGLESVTYVGRKPPRAWEGTPAADLVDLDKVSEPVAFFEGCAGEAATAYPKNANVTAAIALAGVGFERTRVKLLADPTLSANAHEIVAEGAFGSFRIRLENAALPENPRSSLLSALSLEHAVRRSIEPIDL
ncbi:L-aspartate dehydrogenase [Hyphomicrobiales bacterium]|nr:L-aspartate dehydrogenase [Hyphomicrobiales bacterium]CAH1671554.1 L-aspartate dehydrogenase [Hyphomicrobiales bacterium]